MHWRVCGVRPPKTRDVWQTVSQKTCFVRQTLGVMVKNDEKSWWNGIVIHQKRHPFKMCIAPTCFSTEMVYPWHEQLELIKVQAARLRCCRRACLSMPSQCHVGWFFKVIVSLIESTSTTCSDFVLTCKDLQFVLFSAKKNVFFQRFLLLRNNPPMIIPPNLPSWLKEICEKVTRLDSRPHLSDGNSSANHWDSTRFKKKPPQKNHWSILVFLQVLSIQKMNFLHHAWGSNSSVQMALFTGNVRL